MKILDTISLMKYKFLKKYFSIVFLLAVFMGSFHHHNDMQEHNSCQICTVNSNISDGDTPSKVIYLTPVDTKIEPISSKLLPLYSLKKLASLHQRASPYITL